MLLSERLEIILKKVYAMEENTMFKEEETEEDVILNSIEKDIDSLEEKLNM